MPVAYPSSLPLPLLDKTREQPAAFQMAQPRRGFGYVEPAGCGTPAFWPVVWRFTAAEAQAFIQWFTYTIERGLLPFTMRLRTEFGLLDQECQFSPDGLLPAHQVATDVWEYRATIMSRKIAGECVTLYENFVTGLPGYATLRGSAAIYTASGNVLTAASQTSATASTIQKALQTATISVRKFGVDFRCTSVGFDDSASMFVTNGSSLSSVLAFYPIRDTAADALRRPLLYWTSAGEGLLGSGQVTLNTWYRFRGQLSPGVGLVWSIINLDTPGTWGSGTVSLPSAQPFTGNSVAWNADAPNTTGAVQFRNAWISDCTTLPTTYPSTLPLAMLDKTREQDASFVLAQARLGYAEPEASGTDRPTYWPVMWRFTESQAQTFRTWFGDSLERGTLPFTMPIRTEFGLEEFELQFLPDSLLPARHIGGGVWEYSATVTARDTDTEAECFIETFDEGLTPYTTTSGDVGIFAVSDGVLHIDAQSGGSAYVQRVCPVADPVVTFSGRVRITGPTTDDSCGAYLYTGGGTMVAFFQPRSPIGADALQRAQFWIGSESIFVGSAAIVAGEWYRWSLTIATGAGQSFCVITRESNGLSSAEAFTLSHSPATVASLRFWIDSAATTAETDFDFVRVCPH